MDCAPLADGSHGATMQTPLWGPPGAKSITREGGGIERYKYDLPV